jgi:hypothetical protein
LQAGRRKRPSAPTREVRRPTAQVGEVWPPSGGSFDEGTNLLCEAEDLSLGPMEGRVVANCKRLPLIKMRRETCPHIAHRWGMLANNAMSGHVLQPVAAERGSTHTAAGGTG